MILHIVIFSVEFPEILQYLLNNFVVSIHRAATVGKKIWKMKFFPGQGMSGNLQMARKIWKGLTKSGNLKINGFGRLQKHYIFYYEIV